MQNTYKNDAERDLYLRKVALGEIEGEMTGYPSIDKPWLKYYKEKAINAKLPECTIYEYLWENNKEHLDNIALEYFGTKISYKKLFERIESTANAFSAIGVRKGDIVPIMAVNLPAVIYCIYALNRIGAIPNMIDPRTNAKGLRNYLDETNSNACPTIFGLEISFDF